MPVLIIASYDKEGRVDAMNAAWGGIGDYEQITMCLSAGHKTVKNILEKKAFTVSVATEKYVKECDYLGLVSANDNPDKFAKAPFEKVVKATKNGYIHHVDTEGYGIASLLLGAGRNTKEESIDFSAGTVLYKKTGDYVREGEPIAIMYTSDENRFENAERKFIESTTICEQKPVDRPIVLDRVE